MALIEGILQQRGLDHHKRAQGALAHDDRAVIRGFIGARAKGLQEMAAPQMVHELWEHGQLRCKPEAPRVVLAVVRELGDQADQHPIHPFLAFALRHGVSGGEDGRGLLVEPAGDVHHIGVGVPMGDRRHAQALPPGRVAIGRLELKDALLAGGDLTGLAAADELEVEGNCGLLVQRPHEPLARPTFAHLGLRDVGLFLARRRQATDGTLALDLCRREDLDPGVEAQLQVPGRVAFENLDEGLLEYGHAEAVAHHHVATCFVGHDLHLVQPYLVEGACENVDRIAIRDCPPSKVRIVFQRTFGVSSVRLVLLQV
mmetsp:Transcript_62641/g.191615  ORF Transcript_62641/g.191615 Transcript_62641/m.191615 type:complete len:314 (-) Transcript_62641:101-1042(-)